MKNKTRVELTHQDLDGELTSEFLNIDIDSLNFIDVKSIKKNYKEEKVYDLKIEDTPNYVLKNGGIVHNGGGKRKGSFAMYIEPWHSDIFDFLELRKNHGKEEQRARDLFLALWTPDLFMERVEQNGTWSLFSPNQCPELTNTYGDEFKKAYEKYEAEGKAIKTVNARDVWNKVVESQIETGTPYMLYKDSCNEKSNQKNLGIIKSSNLCTEIIEYASPEEVAVCNLGSIALNKFVSIPNGKVASKDKSKRTYNFQALYDVAYQLAVNLNKVIDENYYPVPEAEYSNKKNRPIGIGVQGLADTFAMMGHGFDSDLAKVLNTDIFETIYFAAMTASKDLAKKHGAYKSYKGSPISKGKFQYDLWGLTEDDLSGRWNWKKLKKEVEKYGVRNSLLMAPMPTASTAQILGNNECFEPFTSNLFKRNTLSGEYVVINKHLVEDLVNLGLWDEKMRLKLFASRGSVQEIDEIPQNVRDTYKTVWEISGKDILQMSADRGPFICQSQSMNLFIRDVNAAKLTSAHFYGWKLGLKTGMYYLRTQAATEAKQSLGIDMEKLKEIEREEKEKVLSEIANNAACSLDNPDDCEACGA